MKLIKKLIVSVLSLVIIAAAVLVGGYYYILNTYQIDLLKTLEQLNVLSQQVDEEELCPNAFSTDDMVDVQTIVNQSAEDYITYTQENGYFVNFDNLPEEMKYIIKLTDKQVGALAQTVIKQELDNKVEVGGQQLGIELKQVDFSINESNEVSLNTIIALDISSLINQIPQGFPFDYITPKIPKVLYVSSTINVNRTEVAFSYEVAHKSLTLNNLSADQTQAFFHTLNVILNIGESESLNVTIGNAVMDAMVGNEEEKGFAYSLKDIGATDYEFLSENGVEYFAVLR